MALTDIIHTKSTSVIHTKSTSLTLCDFIIKLCGDGLPVLLTGYCAETGEELFSGNLNRRGLQNLTFTDCYEYLYDPVTFTKFYAHGCINCVDAIIDRKLVRDPL